MSYKREKEFSQKMGFAHLGESEVEVKIPLLTEEKIQLGKPQATSLLEIKRLEAEFAKVRTEYKNKIESHQIVAEQSSEMLATGCKNVRQKLPCFLDQDHQQKHWVDLDTGEILVTQPASPEDLQIKMFHGSQVLGS